jgi:fructose-1,6-bisphosphatase/inositol monophosphatase family enzyme
VVGVIFNPFLDEMYTGWRGGGSYLNGQVLKVGSAKVRAGAWGEVGFERSMKGYSVFLFFNSAKHCHCWMRCTRGGAAVGATSTARCSRSAALR